MIFNQYHISTLPSFRIAPESLSIDIICDIKWVIISTSLLPSLTQSNLRRGLNGKYRVSEFALECGLKFKRDAKIDDV